MTYARTDRRTTLVVKSLSRLKMWFFEIIFESQFWSLRCYLSMNLFQCWRNSYLICMNSFHMWRNSDWDRYSLTVLCSTLVPLGQRAAHYSSWRGSWLHFIEQQQLTSYKIITDTFNCFIATYSINHLKNEWSLKILQNPRRFVYTRRMVVNIPILSPSKRDIFLWRGLNLNMFVTCPMLTFAFVCILWRKGRQWTIFMTLHTVGAN